MSSMVEATLRDYFDKNPYDSEVIGIDVETTGFGDSARLVEVAAVGYKFDGLHLSQSKFVSLVNPGIPIPPEVTKKVHGITDDMVKDAPSESEVMEKLAEFLKTATSLIAHNADFDRTQIANAFARSNQPFPFSDKFKCSLQLARRKQLPITSNKLVDVATHLGYTNENAHRAFDDALCALYVWSRLIQL